MTLAERKVGWEDYNEERTKELREENRADAKVRKFEGHKIGALLDTQPESELGDTPEAARLKAETKTTEKKPAAKSADKK